MTAYLASRRLASPQYRSPRRARLTGAIVVHTAESVHDKVGPDTGAENVAEWMTRRTDPGSYHDLVDSDSCVHLVDYDDEAFHDGTGGNRWSLGLSFACRTTDWAAMTPAQRNGFIEQGAQAATRMMRHVKARTGVVVPAKRITAVQYRASAAGFVSHGELDPGRRSDPGNKPGQFPWDQFLRRVADLAAPAQPAAPKPHLRLGSKGGDVRFLQAQLNKARRFTKHPAIAEDGVFGPATEAAVKATQKWSNDFLDAIGDRTTSRVVVHGVVGPGTSEVILAWANA